MKPCFLVLADGTVLNGESFGAEPKTPNDLNQASREGWGEVVFNTGMTGYHEILTDPSYTGQIVTMTYPHIGNYGDDDSWSEIAREGGRRLAKVKASAFIVRSLYRGPVPSGRKSLHTFLELNKIPGISEVDTRALTLRLRDRGAVNGVIVRNADWQETLSAKEIKSVVAFLKGLPDMEGQNLVTEVGTDESYTLKPDGEADAKTTIGVVDCGLKENIVRELLKYGCSVTVFPAGASAEKIKSAGLDGVLFSNGPGDPAVLPDLVKLAKDLIGSLPVFGICLGHQLIGQALGGKTYKMKFGHHGVNHPVRDELTKKVFVTSQNHGFAVDLDTVPQGVKVWFMNANDKTVEGLIHDELQVKTTQFHPESAPGPHDSSWIFEEFIKTASEASQKNKSTGGNS